MEEKKTHRQIVTAIGHDGNETYVLSMVFEMNQGVDIIQAVKKASKEFIQTDIGRSFYRYTCNCFNWGDFWNNVPNEICKKYGFRKIDSEDSDFLVDLDEQLLDDEDEMEE